MIRGTWATLLWAKDVLFPKDEDPEEKANRQTLREYLREQWQRRVQGKRWDER